MKKEITFKMFLEDFLLKGIKTEQEAVSAYSPEEFFMNEEVFTRLILFISRHRTLKLKREEYTYMMFRYITNFSSDFFEDSLSQILDSCSHQNERHKILVRYIVKGINNSLDEENIAAVLGSNEVKKMVFEYSSDTAMIFIEGIIRSNLENPIVFNDIDNFLRAYEAIHVFTIPVNIEESCDAVKLFLELE